MSHAAAYEYNLGRSFERVAATHVGATALWFNERDTVTYGELNRLANRIARTLLAEGITRADVVCLSGTKTLATFATIIGCLKIGAIYAIVDPNSPEDRLRKILTTCNPRLVVAAPPVLARLAAGEGAGESRKLLTEREVVDRSAASDPTNLTTTDDITGAEPAYVMFTSGSTGVPKGAVMTHDNVLNLIRWAQATYGIGKDDVGANVNPLFFDNSVFDLYSTLFSGARLVPFTWHETRDPKSLVEKVDAARCTQWFSVPSLLMFLQAMKATDGRHLRSLRRFIFGGEGYPKAKLKPLFDTYSDTAAFFNVYGPTECTCICSSFRLTAEDFTDLEGFPPLGRLAENFRYVVLGEDGHSVVPGESGELCLLGPNVGLGYYNDADRTSWSFVQNPLNARYREIMYRTGDIVRMDLGDGRLYIHGRLDNQIKHMGYRIELEEIEAALHRLPYVREAVALHGVVRGLSRLSAVLSLHQPVDDSRVRTDLCTILPDYMIPSVLYHEDVLPKNANGKIDRKMLRDRYSPADR